MIDILMACGATAVVCFSAGTVFGAWWASRKLDELELAAKADLQLIRKLYRQNRERGRELAEFRAARAKSNANLTASNAKRKAARIAREAEARAVREATHSGMRAKLEAI